MRAYSVLWLAVVLPACAESPAHRVRSLAEQRYEAVVMQHWDTSCGAAALATLLTYDFRDPVSEAYVARAMLEGTDAATVRAQGGFSLLDLQRFAVERGYAEASGYGQLDLAHLQGMTPAIIPISVHGYDHFVVVRAVGEREVEIADPAFGRRSVSLQELERAWEQRVAFVVHGLEGAAEAPASEPDRVIAGSAPVGSVEPEPEPEPEPEDSEDEDEDGALERALVRRGAGVLPPLALDLEPALVYGYGELGGARRDSVRSLLGLRLGLPWQAQAEATLPLVFERQEHVGRRFGVGDVWLGVTKLLLAERPAVPELLMTASWKLPTGNSQGPLPLGNGASTVQPGVTALKRLDPVVLYAHLYYAFNLPAGQLDLGDAAGTALGTVLAATPDTSLSATVDVASWQVTRVAGARLDGSDRLSGTLRLAASTILSRRFLLNVATVIGFTPAAPDFALEVALPARF